MFCKKKAKIFTAHRSKHRRESIPRAVAAETSISYFAVWLA